MYLMSSSEWFQVQTQPGPAVTRTTELLRCRSAGACPFPLPQDQPQPRSYRPPGPGPCPARSCSAHPEPHGHGAVAATAPPSPAPRCRPGPVRLPSARRAPARRPGAGGDCPAAPLPLPAQPWGHVGRRLSRVPAGCCGRVVHIKRLMSGNGAVRPALCVWGSTTGRHPVLMHRKAWGILGACLKKKQTRVHACSFMLLQK